MCPQCNIELHCNIALICMVTWRNAVYTSHLYGHMTWCSVYSSCVVLIMIYQVLFYHSRPVLWSVWGCSRCHGPSWSIQSTALRQIWVKFVVKGPDVHPMAGRRWCRGPGVYIHQGHDAIRGHALNTYRIEPITGAVEAWCRPGATGALTCVSRPLLITERLVDQFGRASVCVH